MNLDCNRDFAYKKKKILLNHPTAICYEVSYSSKKDEDIYFEMFIPKRSIKGIIVEFPELMISPKDYLHLSRYIILGYVVVNIHLRNQVGKSKGKISKVEYFPLLSKGEESLYYIHVFQDALDIVKIVEKEFPKIPIYLFGVGQGASISLVIAAINKNIDSIFIADCALCDMKTIYSENKDDDYYISMRKFIRDYPENEDELLEVLDEIDVLNFVSDVDAKVYYCLSHLDVKTPLKCQEKVINLLKNREVINYRKLEYKTIFQHAFDDYLLTKLAEKQS